LAKYLMSFTGEARYGDWVERLLYNAIGAALPIVSHGKHFYYANYHLGAGYKVYSRNIFTCCSGTYFQNVVEYHNLIYFQDKEGIYVNLYLPSELEWASGRGKVRLNLDTTYPEAEKVNIEVNPERPIPFKLCFRVPGWSRGMELKINGAPAGVEIKPGQWATISRQWHVGDKVEISIPLFFRRVPIDRWHPDRVAIMRGPVVYAQQIVHKHLVTLPRTDAELNEWLVPTDRPTVFQYQGQEQASQRDDFKPFYEFVELEPYRLYFDPKLRNILW